VSRPRGIAWKVGRLIVGIVRGVLGLLNAASLVAFGRSVQKSFGTSAGVWYALFQASQFHAIYYASRTLPNMFAFVFSKSYDLIRTSIGLYQLRQFGLAKLVARIHCTMEHLQHLRILPAVLISAHDCRCSLPLGASDLGGNNHHLLVHHSEDIHHKRHHPSWTWWPRHWPTLHCTSGLVLMAIFPAMA